MHLFTRVSTILTAAGIKGWGTSFYSPTSRTPGCPVDTLGGPGVDVAGASPFGPEAMALQCREGVKDRARKPRPATATQTTEAAHSLAQGLRVDRAASHTGPSRLLPSACPVDWPDVRRRRTWSEV